MMPIVMVPAPTLSIQQQDIDYTQQIQRTIDKLDLPPGIQVEYEYGKITIRQFRQQIVGKILMPLTEQKLNEIKESIFNALTEG